MKKKQASSDKQRKAPRLPKEFDHVFPGTSLEDNTSYAQLWLSRSQLQGQGGEHIAFDQVVFEQVNMNKLHCKRIQVLDSRFIGCDLANAAWLESNVVRLELIGCQLTGFQAHEGKFQDILFQGCLLSFAQFAFSKFQAVQFENCDLSEANFYQADLTGAIFKNCNLQQVDFSGAKLLGADLRGSNIDGMRVPSLDLMKGVIIDQTQAISFLRGMGIKIEFFDEVSIERKA